MELEGGQLITVVFIPQDKGIAMYQTILQECRKLFYNVSSQYDEVLKISIEKDDSSCLIGDIDSNRYIVSDTFNHANGEKRTSLRIVR